MLLPARGNAEPAQHGRQRRLRWASAAAGWGASTAEAARACLGTALSSPAGAAGPALRQESCFSNLLVFSVCFFFLNSNYNPVAVACISITGDFSCFRFWFPYGTFRSSYSECLALSDSAPSMFAAGQGWALGSAAAWVRGDTGSARNNALRDDPSLKRYLGGDAKIPLCRMGIQARATLAVPACNSARSQQGSSGALAGGDVGGGHHVFSPDVVIK